MSSCCPTNSSSEGTAFLPERPASSSSQVGQPWCHCHSRLGMKQTAAMSAPTHSCRESSHRRWRVQSTATATPKPQN
ncbi:MAG: hypothetical protein ACYTGX_07785, partial [Planctomycetota bacterium]